MPAPRSAASPARTPALDGLRGAAALAVFMYHYGGGAHAANPVLRFAGKAIHLGWAGVTLFFVLSGYLITGILLDSLDRPGWWRDFYRRRAFRIFPLYYTSLLGAILLLLVTRARGILPMWPFFFYLQDVPGVVHFDRLSQWLYLGHFWSLAVEEQFYLVWPFLLLFAARRGKVLKLCTWVCALSFLYRVAVFRLHLSWPWAGYFIAGRAGEMAAGAFLAAALRHSLDTADRVLRFARPLLLASGLGTLGVVVFTHQTLAGEPSFGTVGILFLTGASVGLIACALQPGWWQKTFETWWLRRLGGISYGIYVYQMLLSPLFAKVAGRIVPGNGSVAYQLCLMGVAAYGTLAAASISFWMIERPMLELREAVKKPQEVLALT